MLNLKTGYENERLGVSNDKLRDEELLQRLILNSTDTEKAVAVAIKVILGFLARPQSFEAPCPCSLEEQDETT